MAITKCDKLGANQRAGRIREIRQQLDFPAEAVLPTSATKGFGIPELWGAVDAALRAPVAPPPGETA